MPDRKQDTAATGVNRRSFLKIVGSSGALAGMSAYALPGKADSEIAGEAKPPKSVKVVPSFCEICFWKCGILAHVEDGVVKKITGNPAHPLSRGRLCPRGAGGTGLLYDEDRLTKPLIRVGERGSERFREASWEEALDRVAKGFRELAEKHGPESLAMLYHGAGASFFKTLLKAYGTHNIAAPSYAQCRGPRDVGFELTIGEGVGSPEPLDIANARALMLIGSHLGENMHNTQVQDFAEGLSRGMNLIVADPRFSTAAGKAELWLPVRPGTDIALILGIMNVILENSWYDKAWLKANSIGLDKLEKHVARYTPEAVFVETGIEPKKLRKAAKLLAQAAPHAIVHPGRKATWYGDDAQRSRAIAMLNALLGNWGKEGGFYITSKAKLKGVPGTPKFPKAKESADRLEGEHVFASGPLASGLRKATLTGKPYPIKGWFVYGSNLPNVLPNPKETLEAIQKLDFLVVVDVLPAEICGYADVVLPECSYLERHDDLHAPYYREPYVAIRQPAVDPLGDSKPGWWMAKELAKRLGLEKFFPWRTPEELHTKRLIASGYKPEAQHRLRSEGVIRTEADPIYLERDEKYEYQTPSGKIEFYSQQLADAGFDPMPVYRRPEGPGDGEFRLLTGRTPTHTFGRTANNALLLEPFPENEVWLNDSVARAQGIGNGDYVMLTNQDGAKSGPVKVKATRRIRADCVFLVHGFGHKAKGLSKARGKGADDCALMTRYKTDPLMGGTGMHVNFVRLEKAEL